MIVSCDTRPERQIYHIGALILKEMQGASNFEVFDLFEKVRSVDSIPLNLYLLSLDWLFLLNAVIIEKGQIRRCS